MVVMVGFCKPTDIPLTYLPPVDQRVHDAVAGEEQEHAIWDYPAQSNDGTAQVILEAGLAGVLVGGAQEGARGGAGNHTRPHLYTRDVVLRPKAWRLIDDVFEKNPRRKFHNGGA